MPSPKAYQKVGYSAGFLTQAHFSFPPAQREQKVPFLTVCSLLFEQKAGTDIYCSTSTSEVMTCAIFQIENGSSCSGPRKIHHSHMTHCLCSFKSWSFPSEDSIHLVSHTHWCQSLCSAAPVPHLWCLVSFFWNLLATEDGRFWFLHHYPTERQSWEDSLLREC